MAEEITKDELKANKGTAVEQAAELAVEASTTTDVKTLVRSKIFWVQVGSLALSGAAYFGVEESYLALIPAFLAPALTVVFRYANKDIKSIV